MIAKPHPIVSIAYDRAEIAMLKTRNAKMKALLLEFAVFMECDECDTAAVDSYGICLVCGFKLFGNPSKAPSKNESGTP